jgi:hypothetical protein
VGGGGGGGAALFPFSCIRSLLLGTGLLLGIGLAHPLPVGQHWWSKLFFAIASCRVVPSIHRNGEFQLRPRGLILPRDGMGLPDGARDEIAGGSSVVRAGLTRDLEWEGSLMWGGGGLVRVHPVVTNMVTYFFRFPFFFFLGGVTQPTHHIVAAPFSHCPFSWFLSTRGNQELAPSAPLLFRGGVLGVQYNPSL